MPPLPSLRSSVASTKLLLERVLQLLLNARCRHSVARAHARPTPPVRHRLPTQLGTVELSVPATGRSQFVQLTTRYAENEDAVLVELNAMSVFGKPPAVSVRSLARDLCNVPLDEPAVTRLATDVSTELARHWRRQLEYAHPACSARQRCPWS